MEADLPPSTNKMIHNDYPSIITILSSVAIVFLTIALEIFVNAKLTCGTSNSDGEDVELTSKCIDADSQTSPLVITQPQLHDSPLPMPEPVTSTTPAPTPMTFRNECPGCCHPAPTPSVRANRLAIAIILYTLLTTAFVLRIRETQQSGNVNWPFTIIVNILPFTSASLAFLRAFVDALLVRWGGVLRYGFSDEEEGGCVWMPCLLVMAPLGIVWCVARGAVAVVMGRRIVFWWRGEERVRDVEMGGEENEGLVGGFAGGELWDGGGCDDLPAYEDSVVADRK